MATEELHGFMVSPEDLQEGLKRSRFPERDSAKLNRTFDLLDRFAQSTMDVFPGLDDDQTAVARDGIAIDEDGKYDLGKLMDALPILELSDGFGQRMSTPIHEASAGLFTVLARLN